MKILNNIYLKASLVFLFFFTLFLSAHFLDNGFTSGDDPYYHAKHASLIAQSGSLNLVKPWLEFHFFNYAPTDPWWGFHVGMALFVYLFGAVLGVKIFASFLAALIFLVFYLILGKLKIKYAAFWTFFLFVSSSIFSYRLLLERPHLLSMIVFPLAIYLLITNKNFWLFLLALVYALCYHLSPLILLLVGIYIFVDAYHKKQINLKPLIAASGGVLSGIIIHPQSLNYLYISYIHLGQVLFLRLAGVDLNIGGELQIIDFSNFLSGNFLIILLSLLAVPLFITFKKYSRNLIASDFLFLYSSLWFMVALIVPRAVEYWLPAAVLFAAVVFNDVAETAEYEQGKKFISARANLRIISFFLAGGLIVIIFNNLAGLYISLSSSRVDVTGENFKQANLWLKANSAPGSMIFYNNWGMWPMMFYYNDYNHYITGMDPTLLYEYDNRTYWLWHNLAGDGLACDQSTPCLNLSPAQQINLAPDAIKNVFRSKYAVLVNNPPGNLVKALNSLHGKAKLVFKNTDLLIYEML